jgi:O-antigen/teichoic acid export membrane protein
MSPWKREISPLTVAVVLGAVLLMVVVLGWWYTRPKNPPPPGISPPPPEVLEMIKRSKDSWEQQERNMPR